MSSLRELLPVHWLSKDARRKIIELLVSTRSLHQLSQELGISTTAVRKYLRGDTHPSDNTMLKVFEILAPYEEEKVYRIAIEDLTDALLHLVNSLEKKEYREYLAGKLRKVLDKIGGL